MPKLRYYNVIEKRSTHATAVLDWEARWSNLWSKWPIFDLVFYNMKTPPHSSPLGYSLWLPGALKLGTVQTSTSTGTGIMKGQSWTSVFH